MVGHLINELLIDVNFEMGLKLAQSQDKFSKYITSQLSENASIKSNNMKFFVEYNIIVYGTQE